MIRVTRPVLAITLLAATWASATNSVFADENDAPRAASELTVTLNKSEVDAATGDVFTLASEIRNEGPDMTPPLIANLAFVAIDGSTYVDPEDWSSERTLAVAPIASGETETLTWEIKTVMEGDVAAYVVLLPAPPRLEAKGPLAASPALQMHVREHRALNPGGVLPTVFGVPLLLLVAFGGIRIVRRVV